MLMFRVLILCFIVTSASTVRAQSPLREGDVRPLDFTADFRAESQTEQVHWIRRIEETGVRSIRVKIAEIVDQTANDYAVVVRDRIGRVVQTLRRKDLADRKEVWTHIVDGDVARLEVVGNTRPSGLSFKVTEAAFQRTPFVPFSISLPDEREAVGKYHNVPQLFARTRAVAKLSFIADGFASSCTGFMIDDERMLTNHHCVASPPVCATTIAIFGYEHSETGQLNPGQQYSCIEVLIADPALDMALLRLEGRPGTVWGRLELAKRTPTLGEQTYMVQHPAGEPKQISRKGCSVTTFPAEGVAGSGSDTDFGHKCDTLGGSSGSPLLGSDYRVVGLHHFGFGGGDRWSAENRAVRIQRIIDRLGLP